MTLGLPLATPAVPLAVPPPIAVSPPVLAAGSNFAELIVLTAPVAAADARVAPVANLGDFPPATIETVQPASPAKDDSALSDEPLEAVDLGAVDAAYALLGPFVTQAPPAAEKQAAFTKMPAAHAKTTSSTGASVQALPLPKPRRDGSEGVGVLQSPAHRTDQAEAVTESPALSLSPPGNLAIARTNENAPISPPPAEIAFSKLLNMANEGWIERLAQDLAAVGGRAERLHFALSPPTLGRLDVLVERESAAMSVKMLTTTDDAQAVLTQAQPQMLDALRAQGVVVARAEVQASLDQPRRGPPPAPPPPLIEADASGTGIAKTEAKRTGRYA